MFKIGQKVVCVNADLNVFNVAGFKYQGDLDGLNKGEVYTIRGVKFSEVPSVQGWGVYLEEIVRDFCEFRDGEASFHVRRFVPFQENGMKILRSILVEQKENA